MNTIKWNVGPILISFIHTCKYNIDNLFCHLKSFKQQKLNKMKKQIDSGLPAGRKLSLSKRTISNLKSSEMSRLVGGTNVAIVVGVAILKTARTIKIPVRGMAPAYTC